MIEEYLTSELYKEYVKIGEQRRAEKEQREREFYQYIQKEISTNMTKAEQTGQESFEVSYDGPYERKWIDNVCEFLITQGWMFQEGLHNTWRFYFK